jgi:cyclopropane fatty-acyl-phospholipid synthase-like methyltransferase
MSELQRWEERFAAPGYWYGTEPNAFLTAQAHLLKPGQSVLAVGDGEGRNGVWLAAQGLDVHSVDISPTALAKARALAASRGVKLRTEQADITTWEWPVECFDVVATIFIQFVSPADMPRLFAGMKRALKPGGLLLLHGYRPEQLEYRTGGPARVENHYTRALLQQTFGDFAKIDIREHDDMISEGRGHAGMSALIDLVGRK